MTITYWSMEPGAQIHNVGSQVAERVDGKYPVLKLLQNFLAEFVELQDPSLSFHCLISLELCFLLRFKNFKFCISVLHAVYFWCISFCREYNRTSSQPIR